MPDPERGDGGTVASGARPQREARRCGRCVVKAHVGAGLGDGQEVPRTHRHVRTDDTGGPVRRKLYCGAVYLRLDVDGAEASAVVNGPHRGVGVAIRGDLHPTGDGEGRCRRDRRRCEVLPCRRKADGHLGVRVGNRRQLQKGKACHIVSGIGAVGITSNANCDNVVCRYGVQV